MIKGLIPQLGERGKIKIGEKGEKKVSKGGKEFALPRKLDHFIVTTCERDQAGRLRPDQALMKRLTEGNGGKLTEIPVRLLYDDPELNFLTRYACYRGNRCWCSGDGEVASRLKDPDKGLFEQVACPCERQNPFYTGQDRCKVLGTLQVLIAGTDKIGGVWKFRTTSWNSVNAIMSSMALIKAITGGPLAGIPLYMVLSPKTVTVPSTGQNMVVFIVSLEYRGAEEQLAEIGYDLARRRAEHRVRMDQIEAAARAAVRLPQLEAPEEQAEIAEEFFPETAGINEPTCKGYGLPPEDGKPFFSTCLECGGEYWNNPDNELNRENDTGCPSCLWKRQAEMTGGPVEETNTDQLDSYEAASEPEPAEPIECPVCHEFHGGPQMMCFECLGRMKNGKVEATTEQTATMDSPVDTAAEPPEPKPKKKQTAREAVEMAKKTLF